MANDVESLYLDDFNDLLASDVQTDSSSEELPSSYITKHLGEDVVSELEKLDKLVSGEDAISLSFLMYMMPNSTQRTLRLCQALEKMGENKIIRTRNGQDEGLGVLCIFWQSGIKHVNVEWEAKMCEALFLTNNFKILNRLGFKPEELKDKFQKSVLDPWTVKAFSLCRDLTERERKDLTFKMNLNPRHQTLETQILDYILGTNCEMEDFVNLASVHYPPQSEETEPIKQRLKQNSSGEIYKKGAGFVLIINQKIFKRDPKNPASKQFESRLGTDVDRDWLNMTFRYLGATKIRICNNYTDAWLKTELDECVRYLNVHGNQFEWLAVCVLSHGGLTVCREDEVYSCDGIPMDRKEIIMKFADKSSLPSFEHKPKIFVFQACRSREVPTDPDSAVKEINRISSSVNGKKSYPTSFDDFVILSSAVEEFVAFRMVQYGSFYIRTLCEMLLMHGHKDELITITTKVKAQLMNIRQYKSVPDVNTYLSKGFYFNRTKESMKELVAQLIYDVTFRELYKKTVGEVLEFPLNNLDV